MRRLASIALATESVAIVVWWILMFLRPAWREGFMALDAPASTLLAFLVADTFLAALGIAIAAGLMMRARWAWPFLCAHAGAALYASLYALFLPLVGRGGGLGALLMLPVACLSPALAWILRPRGEGI